MCTVRRRFRHWFDNTTNRTRGGETLIVDADGLVARLVAHTCRQPGLSVVYQELLDLPGEKVCLRAEPELAGVRFGDALHRYGTSSLIGLRTAAGGRTLVNPPMDLRIGKGDEVIAISAADETVLLDGTADPGIVEDAIAGAAAHRPGPGRTAMLGWNRRAATVVRRLDAHAPPGSVLDVVAEEADAKAELELLGPALENLTVSFTLGDTADRGTLESLGAGGHDRVIVLSPDEHADSRALVTLLHLREMRAAHGGQYSIVSELNDDGNRRLAQVTETDDFVVGEKTISLLRTRMAEDPHLAEVFSNLLAAETCLRQAGDYVRPGIPLTFHTVVEAARRRDEIAIGYRISAQASAPPTYGVVLNPDKSLPLTFAADDRLIVIATD